MKWPMIGWGLPLIVFKHIGPITPRIVRDKLVPLLEQLRGT
ncbi:MAG: hypothetical protein ABIR73_12170 [Usitatibacter sp.]